jgi:glycosyltransferase involved in cell wall biosynthesis
VPGSQARIVGIVLVKDEDLFVERAVRNVLDFCDEIVLADNGSSDGTPAILERLADEDPRKLRLHSIAQPSASHDLIKDHAGENVWVFGVDGDELYDPTGLRSLRRRLLAGEFDDWWLIRGNALHCSELDLQRGTASGWLAPPSPSMTKLHNFRLIESWEGPCPERLHGVAGLSFKPGHRARKRELCREYPWATSPFRALHVCFLPRSTGERDARPRRNISDMNAPRRFPRRAWARLRDAVRAPEPSAFKLEHYRHSELVTVSARDFFPAPR